VQSFAKGELKIIFQRVEEIFPTFKESLIFFNFCTKRNFSPCSLIVALSGVQNVHETKAEVLCVNFFLSLLLVCLVCMELLFYDYTYLFKIQNLHFLFLLLLFFYFSSFNIHEG